MMSAHAVVEAERTSTSEAITDVETERVERNIGSSLYELFSEVFSFLSRFHALAPRNSQRLNPAKAMLVEGSGTNFRSNVVSYLRNTAIGKPPEKSRNSPDAGTVMAVSVSLTNHASTR